jgi:hypothetical protein
LTDTVAFRLNSVCGTSNMFSMRLTTASRPSSSHRNTAAVPPVPTSRSGRQSSNTRLCAAQSSVWSNSITVFPTTHIYSVRTRTCTMPEFHFHYKSRQYTE